MGLGQMSELEIKYVSPDDLRPYAGNARTHSKKQIRQIADSIQRFGFTNPVIVSVDREVIAGHGRLAAAKLQGLTSVPIVVLADMTEADRRAYVIADNKLAELAGWDRDTLAIELQFLQDVQFDDIEVTGFSLGEIDMILDEASEKRPQESGPDDDVRGRVPQNIVSRTGDLWILGTHRLLCGDARDPSDYQRLLEDQKADVVLTDPPFNVPIDGHVSGLGKVKHQEFAMPSGEMSEREFTDFLSSFLGCAKVCCKDGAIMFVFMDWRHLTELTTAGRDNDLDLKNLVVWAKDNAGMGSFYRSKHELCFVFKNGGASHTNTFELGQHGRYRTNVWEYAGVNTFRNGRLDELAMHPTVKPVAMIADAIRDVTRRAEIVLDPFAGSGTTVIAAEKTGRHARVIEYDPGYCDVIVCRWQKYTGKTATLDGSNRTFEDIETERAPLTKGKLDPGGAAPTPGSVLP
jgi:DNA modification methylase